MKYFNFLFLLLFCISTQIHAQEVYSRLRVHLETHTMNDLMKWGIEADHGIMEKQNIFVSDFSQSDRAILDLNGIHYEVEVEDVTKHFLEMNESHNHSASRTSSGLCNASISLPPVPSHWRLGTMGGYFTYSDMLSILDSMALLYPSLISIKQPISDSLLTYEGRPVYIVKISDNPNINEAAEPKMMYNSLHHAREPLSLSQMIMYMYYLLENYNSNPTVKSVVDNAELYFVPCLNPDGYIYNQTTSPGGGGMWRKNRRNLGGGTFGVDLNRNYGYYWAYDNVGSSPTPTSDTYRGPSAFSEPETRMIRDFVSQVRCEIVLNVHTYGNDVVYPWGFLNQLTPDSTKFKLFASYMTEENNYKYGTGFETVGYNTNGDADDFGYGDSVIKNQYLSMTPECGDAFWMPSSEITTTCQNLIVMNLRAAILILDAATLKDQAAGLLAQSNGFLKYEIQRIGLENTDTFKVQCISLNPALSVPSTTKNYTGLTLFEKRTDSIAYSVNSSLLSGNTLRYLWKLTTPTQVVYDTQIVYFTDSLLLSYSHAGSSLSGWTNSGTQNWGVSTTQYVSAPSSFHDSPSGNYANNGRYTITSNDTIDLTSASSAFLQFYAKWAIENNYDYAQVMAVDVATNVATPLCGLYTQEGTADQDLGNPLYDGAQLTWVKENIDLADFLGKKIRIRYRLVSDAGTRDDGFYFDDIQVLQRDTIGTADTTNVGIQSLNINAIQVYPTHTQDEVIIFANNHQAIRSYQLLDQIGNLLVDKQNINSEKQVIDIHNYATGIYYLKVIDRYNQVQTFKLLKY